jgi:hypothetical protein
MPIRDGDKLTKTRQGDGSYNVTIDLKYTDGDCRYTANVPDPDAFYARVRALADNPPERDLTAEREALVEKKAYIDEQISQVDSLIVARDSGGK